jgi:hypothetical protein
LANLQALADQGEPLRGLFEGKLAGVELAAPRGKLKNRIINTFLSNPLCRDVDALCTKQAEEIIELQAYVRYGICEHHKMASSAENVAKQCVVLCKENRALLAGNERLEDLASG